MVPGTVLSELSKDFSLVPDATASNMTATKAKRTVTKAMRPISFAPNVRLVIVITSSTAVPLLSGRCVLSKRILEAFHG